MKKLILILMLVSLSASAKDLTLDNVKLEIEEQGIKHPEIVLKQAILETGHFKSYNARKRNNIFGFWNSKKKEFMKYAKWEDCVSYYKRWQDRKYSGGDYYAFLKRIGYATDENYIWKLKHIKI